MGSEDLSAGMTLLDLLHILDPPRPRPVAGEPRDGLAELLHNTPPHPCLSYAGSISGTSEN